MCLPRPCRNQASDLTIGLVHNLIVGLIVGGQQEVGPPNIDLVSNHREVTVSLCKRAALWQRGMQRHPWHGEALLIQRIGGAERQHALAFLAHKLNTDRPQHWHAILIWLWLRRAGPDFPPCRAIPFGATHFGHDCHRSAQVAGPGPIRHHHHIRRPVQAKLDGVTYRIPANTHKHGFRHRHTALSLDHHRINPGPRQEVIQLCLPLRVWLPLVEYFSCRGPVVDAGIHLCHPLDEIERKDGHPIARRWIATADGLPNVLRPCPIVSVSNASDEAVVVMRWLVMQCRHLEGVQHILGDTLAATLNNAPNVGSDWLKQHGRPQVW